MKAIIPRKKRAKVLKRHTALVTKPDKEVGQYLATEFADKLEVVKLLAMNTFSQTNIREMSEPKLSIFIKKKSPKIRRLIHHSGLAHLLYGFYCFLIGYLIMNSQGINKGAQKKGFGTHLRFQVLSQRHLTQGLLVVNELARGVLYFYGLDRLEGALRPQWISAYQGAMTVARVAHHLKMLGVKTLLPNHIEDMFLGIDLLAPLHGNRRGLCLQITSSIKHGYSRLLRLNGKLAHTYPKEDQKKIDHILHGTNRFNTSHRSHWTPLYLSAGTADIHPLVLDWCPELFLSLWVTLRQIQPDLPIFSQRH